MLQPDGGNNEDEDDDDDDDEEEDEGQESPSEQNAMHNIHFAAQSASPATGRLDRQADGCTVALCYAASVCYAVARYQR